MAAKTIVDELRRTLSAYLPFSAMERADLDFLIERIEVAYFAPGEQVLAPESGVPSHCIIVRQGRVEAFDRESSTVALEAAAGDCFPLGALLAGRPVTLQYRAVGDCFCLLLSRDDFDQLTRRSPVFLEFCRRKLGVMLDSSRRQLQQAYAVEAGVQQTMETPLGLLIRGAPITCAADTSLEFALGRMNDAAVGSIV
ncbi:MAG: cyclic nucleotide-binding domain-containing protein, partial [Burkholderiaceae bacterium]